MPPELRKLFNEIGVSINALVQDPAVLGEPWRSQLLEIKGQINASLADLPDTDKVPAAQEAAYGLNFLKGQLLTVQSIIGSLTGMIQAKARETSTALASITTEVEKAIKSKTDAGELVPKDTVSDMVSNARKEGETDGFNRGKILSDRRSALALAGIPPEVASTAPDEILLGEEAAFNAARDTAKARVEKLAGVGLTVASAQMKTLPWTSEEIFESSHSTFAEIQSKAKGTGQSNNNVPAAGKPSGFIGGGAGGNAAKPLPIIAC